MRTSLYISPARFVTCSVNGMRLKLKPFEGSFSFWNRCLAFILSKKMNDEVKSQADLEAYIASVEFAYAVDVVLNIRHQRGQ